MSRQPRRLTLPSRGCPKGCAFRSPLMSNVRFRTHAMCKPKLKSRFQVVELIVPNMNARANPKPRPHAGKAAVLRVALQECKSSARAEARARINVGQSVVPQPYRARTAGATRKTSVALPRVLRLELGLRLFGSSTPTPNPSIEGMPKRLRLLCTPHVKR